MLEGSNVAACSIGNTSTSPALCCLAMPCLIPYPCRCLHHAKLTVLSGQRKKPDPVVQGLSVLAGIHPLPPDTAPIFAGIKRFPFNTSHVAMPQTATRTDPAPNRPSHPMPAMLAQARQGDFLHYTFRFGFHVCHCHIIIHFFERFALLVGGFKDGFTFLTVAIMQITFALRTG